MVTKGLRITAVTLKNFLGIDEREYKLGKLTKISGRNASSKTSIIEGIRAALGGGDIARYSNVHQEGEAEVGLVLNNGEYLLSRKGKGFTVKHRLGNSAAYEVMKRPQAIVDDFFDAKLSNPIRFDRAAPGERVDMLLEVLADGLTPDQIREAVGADLFTGHVQAIVQAGGHPLQMLDRIHDALYDERRGVNVSERDKRSSVQQLRETIPAEIAEGQDPAPIAVLEAERDEIQTRVSKVRADAEGAHRAAVAEAQATHDKVRGDAMAEYKAAASKARDARQQRIRDIEAAAEVEIAAIRERVAKATAVEKQEVEAQVDELSEAAQAVMHTAAEGLRIALFQAGETRRAALDTVAEDTLRLDRASEQLATARASIEQVTRFQTLKNQADAFEKEADSLKGRADRLSAGLQSVDLLKAKLLEQIPIEGLSVSGREIMIGKIPYDQVNQAARLRLAARFAALRADKHPLRIVFMDGAEALDEENRQMLYEELVDKLDMQVVASVVQTHDLEVETSDHAVSA